MAIRLNNPLSSLRIRRARDANERGEGAAAAAPVAAVVGCPLPVFLALAALAALLAAAEFLAYGAVASRALGGEAAGFRLFPFAAVPLLLGMLYGPAKAAVAGLAVAVLVWAGAGFHPDTLVVAMAAALMTALRAPRARYARDIWGLLFNQAVAQTLLGAAILCLCHAVRPGQPVAARPAEVAAPFLALCAFAAAEGLLAVYALLPAAEALTKRTSDYSLMACANVGHPLLVRLSREAPGTYHHSMMVADLAQAAADAIGANGLLARVGGCFHDVGKLSKPAYFMENQTAAGNPHDALPPSVSRMIIAGHVKEGVVLAREEGLPAPIARIIESHHGTTAMQWFKLKAERGMADRAAAGRNGAAAVDGFYRYPGPLPETKEETLVSIADSVEAASRSLPSPDRRALEDLVEDVVRGKWADGQFAGSALTGRELETAKASFVSSLLHHFHGRKAYPPQKAAGRG